MFILPPPPPTKEQRDDEPVTPIIYDVDTGHILRRCPFCERLEALPGHYRKGPLPGRSRTDTKPVASSGEEVPQETSRQPNQNRGP